MEEPYYITPFSPTKHYGRALNRHISLLPKDAWVVVRDMDTMPLIPEFGNQVIEAIEDNKDASLITVNTNRVWGRPMDNNPDITHHIEKAKKLAANKSYDYIGDVIPAFCWIFPRRIWADHPFDEYPILWPPKAPNSFDTRWTVGLPGTKVRANHIYLWHTYRLGRNHRNYNHLK